jgi:thiol:disulfide interchange protein DsbD
MIQYRHVRPLLAAALVAIAFMTSASAASGGPGALFDKGPKPKDEFLPVDKAFRVSAVAIGPQQVRVTWVIAPGYYLYQKRLKFTAAGPNVQLGTPQLPKGEAHTDDYFGTQTVYREVLQAVVGVTRGTAASGPVALTVGYQGCADAGLCYPPQTQRLMVELPHQAP